MLTPKEAAARLGVTVRQLNRYQQRGLITPVQNVPRGRRMFTEKSVEDLRGSGNCPQCNEPFAHHHGGDCPPPL